MPNNPVAPIDDESYELKLSLAKKSAVDVLLYAGIGPKTKPLSKNVPYKVFMGPSVGDLFFKNNTDLEEVIKNYQGKNISFHCEDPEVLESNKNQPTHEQKRPEEAENSAVDFALQMIEKYELIGKICHCSTVKGMEKIIAAKKRGIKVTCEVTPHHLYFDETMMHNGDHRALQVNPPIRQTKENRLALIEMLKKGEIDFLATDHAPHTLEEKQKGTSGMPHLDTYGSFASWLMKEHQFTAQDVMRLCAYNPGLFVNQFVGVKYGKIEKGYVGSLTILNVNKPVKIEKNILKTKCGWSPFEGVQFPGRVVYTVVRGKLYKV
jgi:dihydroorotase